MFDELAYSVGFFLGDGALYAGMKKATSNGKFYDHKYVHFGCSDLDAIVRVQDQIEEVYGKRYNMYTYALPSGLPHHVLKPCRKDIFDFFAVNTSWRQEIPQHYFSASREVKLELCRGLMDTDGSCAETIDKNTKCPRWILSFSGNKKQIVAGFASIMQSVGVKMGQICSPTRTGYKDMYYVHPNPRSFHEAGMSFHASRKQAKFDRYVARVLGSETLRAAPMTMGEDIVQPLVKA